MSVAFSPTTHRCARIQFSILALQDEIRRARQSRVDCLPSKAGVAPIADNDEVHDDAAVDANISAYDAVPTNDTLLDVGPLADLGRKADDRVGGDLRLRIDQAGRCWRRRRLSLGGDGMGF